MVTAKKQSETSSARSTRAGTADSGTLALIDNVVSRIQRRPSEGSVAASMVELAHGAMPAMAAMPAAAADRPSELGLYLIRPAAASAAQALSSFRVDLNPESRRKQLQRLKEFRNDTRDLLADVQRWSVGVVAAALGPQAAGSGLISAGMVMQLTPEQASQLRHDVPGVNVLQNHVLSLITPTRRTLTADNATPATAGWHLNAIGQTLARKNGRAYSGKGVRIAVLDTGTEMDHPELGGRVIEGWRIDPQVPAIDHTAVVRDPAHADTDGHGTHVAGLICGKTVGVAPDAELVSVLMMPRGYATAFDFIRCLDWVAEHPEISLVNFSAGEHPFRADMMPFVADLIRTGVLPFFAVGNEGENNTRSPGNYIDGVSVGSVDPSSGQTVSAFSGSGRQVWNNTMYEVPDLVAPGAGIWSCYRDGGFAELDGTSMATPVACGVAACILEKERGLMSPAELFDGLRRTCVPLPGEPAHRQGKGLVKVP